ncbi:hypothetical protein Efla_004599 [Eimeria flavescens]
MDYLLPIEYTQQLQQLQQAAPAASFEEVKRVLKEELHLNSIDEVFSHFEEKPVGAASLAQVHFAVLKSGQPVAVKVQHEDVQQLAAADTRVVECLTRVASFLFPEVKFNWLVSLLRENLPSELDFRKEAANAERCRRGLEEQGGSSFFLQLPMPSTYRSFLIGFVAKCLSFIGLSKPQKPAAAAGAVGGGGREDTHAAAAAAAALGKCLSEYEVQLHVPQVYRHLTTARVLVMERCAGVCVDDRRGILALGIHPLAVSKALSELFGRLVFSVGFAHADPHPGNVLVHLELQQQQQQQQEERKRGKGLLLSSLHASSTERKRGRLLLSLLDHGLYVSLSSAFTKRYARLWLAMQQGDRETIQLCAREFGIEELAGLLAVIISLRTLDSIDAGLQLSRKSPKEARELRDAFPDYFVRITRVLQDVPRELLLLLKTNDLLRAIQGKLQVDEALVLVCLLIRALSLVENAKIEEMKNNGATDTQVFLLRCRLWWSAKQLEWARQLLEIRSMDWTTDKEKEAIDCICNAF